MNIMQISEDIALYEAEINRLQVRIDETDNEAEQRDLEDRLDRYKNRLKVMIDRLLDNKEVA